MIFGILIAIMFGVLVMSILDDRRSR